MILLAFQILRSDELATLKIENFRAFCKKLKVIVNRIYGTIIDLTGQPHCPTEKSLESGPHTGGCQSTPVSSVLCDFDDFAPDDGHPPWLVFGLYNSFPPIISPNEDHVV
ncbi:hypothetical protein CRM22_000821 [Opisthorchis felineus]|uniref:Uncharacterized protein n=1 Tax=Opisthorchis felineus TaxID=147828 RepID=A0A4S2MDL6_OPIFE|nr:hypothetical protein CRM22_000821 [Opisthorchis felineus]